jgi:glycosyltransferase involved in cell wall biosynthesis
MTSNASTHPRSASDRPEATSRATHFPALSVVAPCFIEVETLPELYRRVSNACREQVGDNYEVILINDGSSDGTWPSIVALTMGDPHIVGVNLSRNHGHQLALSAGLSVCGGRRVLIIDADLQDPPELLPQMMALMDDGAEVVYGQRESRSGETWFKMLSAAVFYRILKQLVDIDIPLDTGDFRLMSRRAIDILTAMPEQHRFIRGMVSWIGLDQRPLLYRREKRFAGHTKYPFRKMLRFAADAITGFSVRPLRIAVYFGVLFALGGFAVFAYVLHAWWMDRTIEGWTSTITVVLLLGGVQLLVLGVFGEYLGRLYLESKHRPLFVIDKIVRNDAGIAANAMSEDRSSNASCSSSTCREL